MKTYHSEQSLFAVTSGSNISIYSPISYQCYLELKANVRQGNNMKGSMKKVMKSTSLVSDKMLNQISEGEPIETVGIHPNRPIIGVVFKNVIRVYIVLYNQFKVMKEIQLSHCRQLGFNKSGSIMYAKLSGKQGSKIYLYNTLNNFESIEILNTARPVNQILWTNLDTILYAVHPNGYYTWTTDSMFKQRYDSNMNLSFSITGADVLHSNIVLWSSKNVLLVDHNHNILQTHKLTQQIKSLLVQNNNIIFNTTKGEIYRCKNLNSIDSTMVAPGFKI